MLTRPIRLWLLLYPALLGLIAVAAVVTAQSNHESHPILLAIVFPTIALTFVISGLIAWSVSPNNGTGRLLVLVGFLWTVNAFFESNNGWVLGATELIGSLFAQQFSLWWVIWPGILLGIVVGILPGFSPQNTLIMLLPLTLAVPVEQALAFMIALYCANHL